MAVIHVTKRHHRRINNPFPLTPASLPLIDGSLILTSQTASFHQIFDLGTDFRIQWSSRNGAYLSISHNSQPDKSIWSTVPGRSFISAAMADTEVQESRGSFAIEDKRVLLVCNHQTIEDMRVVYDGEALGSYGDEAVSLTDGTKYPALVITGWLVNKETHRNRVHGFRRLVSYESPMVASARYWLVFDQKTSHQIGFHAVIGDANVEPCKAETLSSLLGSGCKSFMNMFRMMRRRPRSSNEDSESYISSSVCFNRICITYASERNERFFGFGEQFSHIDFKGKKVPILVQEQGIGRGDQPITCAANCISYRSGGNWSTTYAPSPFYMTSKLRSLYLEGYHYSTFDLTKQDRVHIQTHSNSVRGRILHGSSPGHLIENFTDTIGRPPKLPKWIVSGAVVGMQGGTEAVRDILGKLQAYDVPISSFWLQDWVGQRETAIGSQLWWNWEVDTTTYKGWKELIDDLKSQNIKVMAYCNPCLALTDKKPNRRRNYFEEAKKLDILVKNMDGRIYMVPNTAFNVGMLDLTHPSTSNWFKKILQNMVDAGIRGWMADFGEGLPIDAVLYSGEDPIAAHNRYPELWAKINRQFVEEWKTNRNKDKDIEDDLVFFMRAGFRDSPRWGMLFWEGDQMVSWQTNDGIKSAVVGLLSGGLSGYALNHSDIGGYCTINVPFIKYCRSEELLMRWMELNAFTTVFRTHEGNKPANNSQFYSNARTMHHYARCAKLYKAWCFYRTQLVKEAAQKGLPVCRHLFLHYPSDRHVQRITYQQFLVGTEMLVVPVLDKGSNKVKAYFPEEEGCAWQHIWSKKRYCIPGSKVWVDASVGYPAVFVKVGSQVGKTFVGNLERMGIL